MEKFFLFICLFIGTQISVSAQCLFLPGCSVATQAICDTSTNSIVYWNDSLFFDPIVQSHDLSEGPTELSIQIVDTCATEELLASFVLLLDLNGDGLVETAVSSIATPEPGTVYYGNSNNPSYTGGEAQIFDSRDIPPNQKYSFVLEKIVQDSLVTFRVRWANALNPNEYVVPELPYGAHLIRWRFQKNAEYQVCNSSFIVKDCQPPTVACIPDLSVNILPTNPTFVQIWATDFLEVTALPSDNYTPASQLKFGIRRASTGTGFPNNSPSVTFTCDDLGTQPVEVWARDEAGNTSSCITSVLVQDNFGICNPDTSPVNVCVKTACSNFTQGVEGVSFELLGTHPALPPFSLFSWETTNQDGCTALDFTNSIPIFSTFRLTPYKIQEEPLNGVTTYDLVILAKHINGTEPFTENWQWVAADTDLNGVIDSVDLLNCRALIFGETTSIAYPDFRFYPIDYAFPAGNPLALPIPDYITWDSIIFSNTSIQFAAAKTCDFNCNSITDIEEITSIGKIGQPQPNPTAAGLFIPLILEKSIAVTVEILDLTGRSLYKMTSSYAAGEQILEVPATAFQQAGMYTWRVQAGEEFKSGKIIKQ